MLTSLRGVVIAVLVITTARITLPLVHGFSMDVIFGDATANVGHMHVEAQQDPVAQARDIDPDYRGMGLILKWSMKF